MNKLTEETMQALLLQFEGVIYASLKKLAIHKGKQDYDDFYQLGCLKLFDAYHDFDKDPFDETNRYPFVYYASQRLHWAFLDEMRKENRRIERVEADSDDITDLASEDPAFDELVFADQLAHLMALLSPKERLFLADRLLGQLSITAIAKKHAVSRKTVYRWRQSLQKKALFLKEGNTL